MRWTFRADERAGSCERGWREHPRWRLHAARFTDGGRQWQAVLEVDAPGGRPSWWLANSLGFLVDDDAEQPVGVVDDIQMDPDTQHPRALIVVQGWGRSRIVIPIDAVVEIAPDERRLTVLRGDYRPASATAR
jgi:hypothetical protein